MKLDIYHLEGSAFHFGRHGRGQENCAVVFPSDSLFSALTARAAQLFPPPKFDDWISSFRDGSPPCVWTSLFPRAGAVRFYPKPLLPIGLNPVSPMGNNIDVEKGMPPSLKSVRKIAYISEAVFRSLISGRALGTLVREDCLLQGGSVLISEAEKAALPPHVQQMGQIWEMTVRPRVTISRVNAMTELFHLAETRFARDCGLWLGVRWLNEAAAESRAEWEALMTDLGETGIGAERSIGLGQYQITPAGSIAFPDGALKPDQPFITLSRFIPKSEERASFLNPLSAYAIEPVGGWVYSPGKAAERRRSIRMVNEGACLMNAALSEPLGRIVDVQPNYNGTQPIGHPVWRSGYAVAVRCAPPAEG